MFPIGLDGAAAAFLGSGFLGAGLRFSASWGTGRKIIKQACEEKAGAGTGGGLPS